MLLGRINSSRSILERARSPATKISNAARSQLKPSRAATPANSPAQDNSTRGYLAEIGLRHILHFPRKRIQDSTGTLSRSRIGVWHKGQVERGLIIDSWSGTRYITTFKNDPMARPNSPQATMSKANIERPHHAFVLDDELFRCYLCLLYTSDAADDLLCV